MASGCWLPVGMAPCWRFRLPRQVAELTDGQRDGRATIARRRGGLSFLLAGSCVLKMLGAFIPTAWSRQPRRQCPARLALAWFAIVPLLATCWPSTTAAEEGAPRLFELQPYDQITLKDKSVIKITPIEFPAGRNPANLKPSDVIRVRLTERPTEEYELRWYEVAEFKRFDRLILDEAERLASAGKLGDAFAYFDFLERNHPTMTGLKEATEKYLYEDAKDCQRRKKYDEALAVLDELHRRNPGFDGLDRAWGAATDKILESLLAKEDFHGARQRLFNLQSRFPQEPSGLKWQHELESRCAELVAQAAAEMAAGRRDVARARVFAAIERWPADEAARRLALDLFNQAPVLAVGVSQALPERMLDPLTDWASRRASRLLTRSLMELSGYGAEGGVYQCALGQFSVGELGLELNVRLRPNLRLNDGGAFTGYELSRHLIHTVQAQPESLLAQVLDRITVRKVYDVDIALRRPHLRPEVLLSQPIALPQAESEQWQVASLAPFHVADRGPSLVRYVANPQLRAESATGPTEIVEQTYPAVAEALSALARGEVLVIDRLNPWDVAPTRKIEGVVVESYAVPTVHVLVPNLKHPLLARRVFRRALVYGINRQAILQVQLLRGESLADTRVTSGPFPAGYAYNDRVETRPYEPRMAMTLAQIAHKELAPAVQPAAAKAAAPAKAPNASAAGGDDAGSAPPAASADPFAPLRLAHPPTEVARLACRAIQKQLKLIGIPIELVELTAQSRGAALGSFELVYLELQIEEPIADARRLFGAGGIASGSSPHLEQALMRLDAAADWKTAREELHQIHQIAADDVAVIPLWQLQEHLAYRDTVSGLPGRPVTLYQDLEKWQVKPYLPPATP